MYDTAQAAESVKLVAEEVIALLGTVTKFGSFGKLTLPPHESFFECSKQLTSITVPEGVTSIGDSAFDGCFDLTTITFPSSMTGIGKMAFIFCDDLKDVYCYATTPPSTADKKIGRKTITLHVPAASLEAYKATAPWSQFKSIVAIE